MFSDAQVSNATSLLAAARAKGVRIVTAESCTGGLIAALLTEIAGSSDVFDRGFVTYSNAAKMAHLGVSERDLATHGAVSEAVARAMAKGAIAQSEAAVSIAVTGVAGPGGGSPEKPVGRVHMCVMTAGGHEHHVAQSYGDIGRSNVRVATVDDGLIMLRDAIDRI